MSLEVEPQGRTRAEPKMAELVRDIAEKAQRLARKEVELAKVELRADLDAELAAAKGLGAAALLALLALNLLLVCVVFALTAVMAGWLAALLLATLLLAVGAAVGAWAWSRRVRDPLAATRQTLQEDVAWAKQRLH
jgi:uncharacterized membrane protein YqjE